MSIITVMPVSAANAGVSPAVTANPRFQALLRWSNFGLLLSSLLLIATVLICYPLAAWFSMPQQIAAHLALVLSATLLKCCYVGRCVAQHSLQQEVR